MMVYFSMVMALFAEEDYEEVADLLTRGAFLGSWRMVAIDGFGWDGAAPPDTRSAG
jgi:hypothetical protein